MRIVVTAGPTHEFIDPVRYIANRSSGQMGAALAQAALAGGHHVTAVLGPVCVPMPAGVRRVDVISAAQMLEAVLHEFARHDLLIMAAAPADYRPVSPSDRKIPREGRLVIECEATEDIVAAAAKVRKKSQRIVGFALENEGDIGRAKAKLARKGLDLIVYNPPRTMGSATVEAVLIWADGRTEQLPCRSKGDFADILIKRAVAMF